MRPVIFIFTLGMLLSSLATMAQTTELYVYKNVRREHLKAAKKARKEAREKKVYHDFYMRVRTQTSLSTAKMMINMKKSHDTQITVSDMNGTQLAMIYEGELAEGQYEFSYELEGTLKKPFVCRLMIDGKTEAMRVVKFNSF